MEKFEIPNNILEFSMLSKWSFPDLFRDLFKFLFRLRFFRCKILGVYILSSKSVAGVSRSSSSFRTPLPLRVCLARSQ